MNRIDLIQMLKNKVLLTDGAMGTEIYKKGFYINRCYEHLNLTNPQIIQGIHKSYIDASADIIETNTFAANRLALKQYGFQEDCVKINRKAVSLIKEIKENHDILIAGSVGPTGEFSANISKIPLTQIKEAFYEQLFALIDEGVDLIMLETFNSFPEIEIAVNEIRKISKSIPIIASMTFPNKKETIFGQNVTDIAKLLNKLDVDIVGLNCSTGPQRALELVDDFKKHITKPLYVSPNAGYPKNISGRTIYLANEELFGNYTGKYIDNGANIVGGCCGTTSEFIKQMRKIIRQKFPVSFLKNINIEDSVSNNKNSLPVIKLEKRSPFGSKLGKELILSMEILPDKSPNIDPTLKTVESFKDDFNCVNIPDGPRASARMGISAIAHFIQKKLDISTIAHYCCRDRNILGIQSDLMALHALGVHNILAITGDPPKLGNYPDATAVFDIDSIGLIKILSNLNRGLDIVGNEIGGQTSFVIGAGVNPSSENLEEELKRLKLKIEAGAEFIMTQPIYEVKQFTYFLDKIKHYKIPIIIGISPLVSYKMAEFQNNEIPGMEVPDRILNLLNKAQSKKEAREVGINLSVEMINTFKDKIAGIYFMAQGKISRKMSVNIVKRSNIYD